MWLCKCIMKILQVIPYYIPAYTFGGPPVIVHQISKELVRRGHEVVVYTSNAKSHFSRLPLKSTEIIDGVEVHYFRILTSRVVGRLFITPQLVLQARKELDSFDVIHLHEYRTFQNIVVCLFAEKKCKPCILQVHGALPVLMNRQITKKLFDKILGNRLLKSMKKMIALTESEQNQYELIGISKKDIEIIPNGIDVSKYQELPSRNNFRRKHGIPSNTRIILYLGRLHHYKGIDILIESFSHLKTRRNDIVLVIVGPDHGALNELKEQCFGLGISDSVIFTGPLFNVEKSEVFVDADVFVLPSLYEAFPMVLLEAFAFSKPVIASGIDSIARIIEHRKNGLLFKPSDALALEQSIQLLLKNQSLAHNLGANARKKLEEEYTIAQVVDRMEKLYRNCVYSSKSVDGSLSRIT